MLRCSLPGGLRASLSACQIWEVRRSAAAPAAEQEVSSGTKPICRTTRSSKLPCNHSQRSESQRHRALARDVHALSCMFGAAFAYSSSLILETGQALPNQDRKCFRILQVSWTSIHGLRLRFRHADGLPCTGPGIKCGGAASILPAAFALSPSNAAEAETPWCRMFKHCLNSWRKK